MVHRLEFDLGLHRLHAGGGGSGDYCGSVVKTVFGTSSFLVLIVQHSMV